MPRSLGGLAFTVLIDRRGRRRRIIDAARTGDTRHLQQIFRRYGGDSNSSIRNQQRNIDNDQIVNDTALIIAARNGHAPVVDILLRHGAHVDVRNNDGRTALMEAARNGHAPVVDQLLRREADVDADNGDGETALMEAIRNGHALIVHRLMENGATADFRMILYAIQFRRYDVIIQLLRRITLDDLSRSILSKRLLRAVQNSFLTMTGRSKVRNMCNKLGALLDHVIYGRLLMDLDDKQITMLLHFLSQYPDKDEDETQTIIRKGGDTLPMILARNKRYETLMTLLKIMKDQQISHPNQHGQTLLSIVQQMIPTSSKDESRILSYIRDSLRGDATKANVLRQYYARQSKRMAQQGGAAQTQTKQQQSSRPAQLQQMRHALAKMKPDLLNELTQYVTDVTYVEHLIDQYSIRRDLSPEQQADLRWLKEYRYREELPRLLQELRKRKRQITTYLQERERSQQQRVTSRQLLQGLSNKQRHFIEQLDTYRRPRGENGDGQQGGGAA